MMTQAKTPSRLLVAAAIIATSHIALVPANAALVVYDEDFDAFTTGTIDGQVGWSASPASNDGVNIVDLGAGDLAVRGDASGTSTTRKASNSSAYTLSTAVSQIVFDGRLRMRGGFGNRVWFTDDAGAQILGFGAGFGGHNFVVISDPTDTTKLFSGNITGDNALEGNNHRWFDTRFTVDFNDQLNATGTYEVGMGPPQSGLPASVGGAIGAGLVVHAL